MDSSNEQQNLIENEMENEAEIDEKKARKEKRGNIIFFSIIGFFILFFSVILYLNVNVFFLVKVDGDSMNPTLESGNVVTVNRKLTPNYGDIVIIEGEKKTAYLIKRVIAKEGDTVEIIDGGVYLNGKLLEEGYVKKQNSTFATGKASKWTLGEKEIFYLGDNRMFSKDSRDDEYGTCKISQVIGVVEDWSFSILWLNEFVYNLGRGK